MFMARLHDVRVQHAPYASLRKPAGKEARGYAVRPSPSHINRRSSVQARHRASRLAVAFLSVIARPGRSRRSAYQGLHD